MFNKHKHGISSLYIVSLTILKVSLFTQFSYTSQDNYSQWTTPIFPTNLVKVTNGIYIEKLHGQSHGDLSLYIHGPPLFKWNAKSYVYIKLNIKSYTSYSK